MRRTVPDGSVTTVTPPPAATCNGEYATEVGCCSPRRRTISNGSVTTVSQPPAVACTVGLAAVLGCCPSLRCSVPVGRVTRATLPPNAADTVDEADAVASCPSSKRVTARTSIQAGIRPKQNNSSSRSPSTRRASFPGEDMMFLLHINTKSNTL
ncbi:uncharacterized protein LOC121595484 [Anopheles merus]|nr:uncharacterized protein LOC121595484 [Anopheles merus]